MAADDFFSRWSRRKAESSQPGDAAPENKSESSDPQPDVAEPRPLPTIDDIDALTPESDYAAYMSKGVDDKVRQLAMKKLFTDPHFNIMDGLDIYIDDYSKPDPIPAAMLAALNHAKSLLDPLKHLESPTMRMIGGVEMHPFVPAPINDASGPPIADAAEEIAAPVEIDADLDVVPEASGDKNDVKEPLPVNVPANDSAIDAEPDLSIDSLENAATDPSNTDSPALNRTSP